MPALPSPPSPSSGESMTSKIAFYTLVASGIIGGALLARKLLQKEKSVSNTTGSASAASRTDLQDPAAYWNTKFQSQHLEGGLFSMKPANILLFYSALFQRLRDEAVLRTGSARDVRVLEIGAGQGRNGVYLAKEYGFSVEAQDVSAVALERAKQFALEQGISDERQYTINCCDTLKTDLGENQYDIILMLFVQFTPEHAELHKRVAKALRPGGAVVLQGFSPRQLELVATGRAQGGPPFREQLYDLNELRREFGGLVVEFAQEVDRDLTGFGLFSGECALVEFVAVKPIAEQRR